VPQAVAAHAVLLRSDPAPDALVASAPAGVTLIFSEPVTPAGAGIKVYGPSGAQVAGTVSTRGAVLTAPIGAGAPGTYVVAWQVYAADTHPSRGAFAFSIVRRGANPYASLVGAAEAGTATPLGLALQALARWVHFAGFALAFGVTAYRVVLGRRERFGRLVATGVALLIVAEPVAFAAQLASLSFDGDTAVAVLGSEFGRILGLRLAAALLAWTVLATERSWPVLVIGAAVAGLDGATAHAIAGLPVAGQVVAAVHVAAMGLWTGGIAAYLRAPDPRFGRYAAGAFGIAAVTGLVLALAHTSFGSALFSTQYGWALVAKVVVVGAAVVLAVARRRRAELAVVAAAIAAAALVASLPPPA
jgi:copper transport protein